MQLMALFIVLLRPSLHKRD